MFRNQVTPVNVIVTGDFHHRDFSSIRNIDPGSVEFLPFDQVNRLSTMPDLIAIAQSRRGQFSQTEINQLRRRFPLVPIVVVVGSWCEGETRSGTTPVG